MLVLDEPTDGLDPNQKHEVRTLIRKMGETKAIIFSTHILEEVEAACSRAIIIDRGQIVANGTPDELKQRSEHAGAVTVRLLDGSSSAVMQKLNELPPVGKCVVVSESPVTVRAYLKKNGQRGELARAIGEIAADGTLENRGVAYRRGPPGRCFPQHYPARDQEGGGRMSEAALDAPAAVSSTSAGQF